MTAGEIIIVITNMEVWGASRNLIVGLNQLTAALRERARDRDNGCD